MLSIFLDRSEGELSLEAIFHLFQMTNEVDERGYYVLKNHTMVKIRFDNIVLYELKWFNQQNSIDDLEVGSPGEQRRFTVYLPSNWGCDAQFECDRIKVVSVGPYTPMHLHSDGVTMLPPQPI